MTAVESSKFDELTLGTTSTCTAHKNNDKSLIRVFDTPYARTIQKIKSPTYMNGTKHELKRKGSHHCTWLWRTQVYYNTYPLYKERQTAQSATLRRPDDSKTLLPIPFGEMLIEQNYIALMLSIFLFK